MSIRVLGSLPRAGFRRLACLLFALAATLPAAESAWADSNSAKAAFLVDLARDHGLLARGKQTSADVRIARAWLDAARRVDPNNWDAALWLYELAALEGDEAASLAVLEKLVAIDPNHEQAFTLWLDAGARSRQRLEARRDWLSSLLATPRPPFAEASVRTRLAECALERLDLTTAREHLARARALDPLNPEAAILAVEALAHDAPPAERLAALLRALQLRPLRGDLAWSVGSLLDEIGLHGDAAVFFEYAVQNERRLGQPITPAMRLKMMRNHAARGLVEQAVEIGRAGLDEAQNDAEYQMVHFWLSQRAARPFDTALMRVRLDKLLSQVKDPNDWPVRLVAQAAWYHCTIDPQAERALSLAEAAAQRAPGDPFVTRVLGWAQILSGKDTEGRGTLLPLARTDAFAAYQLARLKKEEGDEAGAAALVQALGYVPRSTYAFDLLAGLNLPSLTSQPAPQDAAVGEAFKSFVPDVMNFWSESARFLEARIEMEKPTFEPARPWVATFSLTNRATFPIPLGPDGLVNPTFLVSLSMEGDRKRDFPNLMTVSVDAVRVLRPGQTVQVRRTLSVGPGHRAAVLTPQQIQRIIVTAILDPQLDRDGAWQAGPTGQRLRAISFNRLPVPSGPDAWNAMMTTLRDGRDTDRATTLALLGQLLGEHQRHARQSLAYRPQAVPSAQIEALFASMLRGDSPEMRLRSLDALMVAGLDATLTAAAGDCLKDDDWLVRMMAVRLLARQGEPFRETAQALAASDSDECVRSLAQGYVERWSPAASQPVTTSGPSSRDGRR